MKLVVFFLFLSHLADARDWQVWVFIGQSLMNGPVGDVSDLSDSSHDGEILQYVRGLDSNRIQNIFSTKYSCPHCGYTVTEVEPKLFSFNSPAGACESCDGLGVKESFYPSKIIVNQELSLLKGAIYGWDDKSAYYSLLLQCLS